MRCAVMLLCLTPLIGCTFSPDLEGQGYLRCEVQADCAGTCACGREGYCLPPDGLTPGACEPGPPSVAEPGRLLLADWTDPDATRTLDVDAPGDAPFAPEDSDFELAFEQAMADDGALSLREAAALAGLSDKPVRIRFARGMFPPDGSGPTIVLNEPVTLTGEQILLDGRETGELIAYGGDPTQVGQDLLTVSGRVLALAGLRIEGYDQRAVRIYDAQGVYLIGLSLADNRIGLWIQASSGVSLTDGRAYLGEAGALPNTFQYNNTGLVIVQSEKVRVNGTELAHNLVEGARLGEQCQDVSFGPTPGEDGRAWTPVLIEDNHVGIDVIGFDGRAGVRGALLVGNAIDVSIQGSQGLLAFTNVTVADSGGTVIEHHDVEDGNLLLALRNLIVHGRNPELTHLRCYGIGDTLTINADKMLFSSPVNIDCTSYTGGFGQDATIWEGLDPGFVDPDHGDFHLAADCPAVDVGVDLDYDGASLDFNGPAPGLFCGDGPDLGAYERCP